MLFLIIQATGLEVVVPRCASSFEVLGRLVLPHWWQDQELIKLRWRFKK